jgi:uncharacterized membrane protein
MRRYAFALPLITLTACSQPAVSESNQSVIEERARSLERAADTAVDQSIAQMARETAEETNASLADDSGR